MSCNESKSFAFLRFFKAIYKWFLCLCSSEFHFKFLSSTQEDNNMKTFFILVFVLIELKSHGFTRLSFFDMMKYETSLRFQPPFRLLICISQTQSNINIIYDFKKILRGTWHNEKGSLASLEWKRETLRENLYILYFTSCSVLSSLLSRIISKQQKTHAFIEIMRNEWDEQKKTRERNHHLYILLIKNSP